MKKYIYLCILIIFNFSCQPGTKKSEDGMAGKSKRPNVEKSFYDLNGQSQYVEFRSTSKKNPVLLFIHGGPGWPQTPQLRYFSDTITNVVTLVAWEQPGAGQSYLKDPAPRELSLEELIRDGHQLTLELKKKFGQERIFLAGFSWGSVIGLRLAQAYPEDYLAYFGISQSINVPRAMGISRSWLREQAKGDTQTLNAVMRLEKGDTSICNSPLACFIKQYELVSKYHGAVYNPSSDEEVNRAMTLYEDYKNYDWEKAFEFSASRLEKDLFQADLSTIHKIDIPVYFLLGRHDWNVPSVLGAEYASKLEAPYKEVIWFENSGHGPLEEEPALFNKIIMDKCSEPQFKK